MDDNTNMGCCNMIIWDCLTVFIVAAYYLNELTPLHMVFCITLGIIITILFFAIMNIPYFGIVVQLFCCYVWYVLFDELLPIDAWTEGDNAARIFCKALLGILILLLHFASFYSLKPDTTIEPSHVILFSRHYEKREYSKNANSSYFYDDTAWQNNRSQGFEDSGNSYQQKADFTDHTSAEEDQDYWNDQNENNKQNYDEYDRTYSHSDSEPESEPCHPFYGCTDVESLKIRYKKLARAYHPDDGGNEESFKYLQNEYERLLKKYEYS